jgi:hypothetical protein
MATAKLSVELEALTSKYVADLNRAADKLKEFSDKATRAGTAMTAAFTVPLALLARTAINSGAELDGLNRSMIAITGSAEAAAKQTKILNEVAKLPGLNFKDSLSGFVQLKAAGFSTELATKSLQSFGNALGVLGKTGALGSVNQQLQQMATRTGSVGEDMRILKAWVPQVGGALKEAFGTENTELIAQMGFTGKDVVEKLVEVLGKLPKATGGIGNALENMQDAWFKFTGNMGLAIDKAIDLTGIFDSISAKLTELAESFKNLDPGVQKLIIGLGAFAFAAGPVMLFMVKFGALLIPVTAAVVALGGAFVVAGGHMEAFRKIQADLFDSMADKVSKLVDKLGNMFRIFVKIKEIQLGKVLGLNTTDAERDLVDLKSKGAAPFKYVFPKANQSLDDLRKEIEAEDALRRSQMSKGGPTVKGKGDDSAIKAAQEQRLKDYEILLEKYGLADDYSAKKKEDAIIVAQKRIGDHDKTFNALRNTLAKTHHDYFKTIELAKMGSVKTNMSLIEDSAKNMIKRLKSFKEEIEKLAKPPKSPVTEEEFKDAGKYDKMIGLKGINEAFPDFIKRVAVYKNQLAEVMRGGAVDALSGMAEWAGAFAVGVKSFKDLGSLMKGIFGDILINMGKLTINFAITSIGIKKALENLAFGNPFGAVAVGMAAIAAGSALKASASKGSSGGYQQVPRGSVSNYQPIYTPYTNTGSNNGARISVELIGSNSIRGNDIITSYNQTVYDRSRG